MIDPHAPDYSNIPGSTERPSFRYAPASSAEGGGPPAVSIVTPFYNTGEIFHETAASVLGQSLQDWEWLIINDGSTEQDALAVLACYRDRDPRIRVIDLPANAGLSAARNVGYRSAQAPYVLQLDSDDLLETTAAEKWLWYLDSHPDHAFVKGYSIGFGAEHYLWERGFHEGAGFLEENLVDPTSLLRRSVHQAVGGYDESIRGGLEDWDFWLRCANQGYWGDTIREYLDWYRRRPRHRDRWTNWDGGRRQEKFRARLRQQYPRLWEQFPRPERPWPEPYDTVVETLPTENRLEKRTPRILLVVPWLTMGGADRFNLELVDWLTTGGWEVSIATTINGDHSWMPEFARFTPDIFPLHNFLRIRDFPRFLRYLIHSRGIDTVLISHSELGYLLLPYLRHHCPGVTFMDYCHIVEEYWRSGGYPRMSLEYQELLDLTVVASQQVWDWMVQHGADRSRIEVCYIGIDARKWRPDQDIRSRTREELRIADEQPVVLFAGRLVKQKRPDILVESLALLGRRGNSFTALIAGDGPEMANVRSSIALHGLEESVFLLGGLPPARVRELLQAADVFFLPSHWEGIALSIYEAMACAVPVVGADVGGQRELVTPSCGVLLPRQGDRAREVEAYAAELERLLTNQEIRRAMGAASRLRVEQEFAIEQTAQRMVSLVELAQRLHCEKPRPRPMQGLARTCAFQAIELVRLTHVTDELWANRNPRTWRARLYSRLTRIFEPLYQWAVRRGWKWLVLARNRLRLAVLGRN